MKKFLLMAAAGLMAFGANAADYYLVGDNFVWSDNETYGFTKNEDGTYTLDLKGKPKNELKSAFKIKPKGTWNNAFGSNGKPFKADEVYVAAKGNSTSNISSAGTIVDAKITLDPTKNTIFATGATKENEYTTIYMVGDFGSGWNDALTTYPMTLKEGSESVWVADYELTAANNYFKFRAGDFIYGPSGSDRVPELGESYEVSNTGDKSFLLHPGKYHFEWTLVKNATSGSLVVTSDQPVKYPDTFFVIGNVNGKDWAANNGVELEKIGEGQFKGTAVIGNAMLSGNGYFSFTESLGASWAEIGTRYGAKSNDFPVVLGEPAEITFGENSFKVKADLNYEFTVDLVKKTVVVNEVVEVVMPTPPEKLTLQAGTSEGLTTAWDANFNEISVTGEVETATAEITVAIPEGFDNFLYIDPTQGGGPEVDPLTRAAAEWLPVATALEQGMQYGNKFTVAADGQEHVYMLYLVANEQFDSANLYTLTATLQQKTGVEAVEVAGEAQYFTLQGVKVTNPSNGIYVKVAGGKASKVTVK